MASLAISQNDVAGSKRIGALVGPSLLAIVSSELPFVQPHLYDEQTPPVVYLSGTLLVVAGLALVRAHNRWRRDWTTLVTLVGWGALALGLLRMFAAGTYRAHAPSLLPLEMAVEGLLLTVGAVITFQSYRAPTQHTDG